MTMQNTLFDQNTCYESLRLQVELSHNNKKTRIYSNLYYPNFYNWFSIIHENEDCVLFLLASCLGSRGEKKLYWVSVPFSVENF